MVSAAIDSGALRHNLRQVRQWAPKSRVMAVIKANAYGHGLVTVARALGSADAFAVARVDEGLTLRGAGIMTRTVLLEGVFDAAQLAAAAAAGFELVVHTREQLELLRAAPAGARFTVITDLNPYRLELAERLGVTLAVNGVEACRCFLDSRFDVVLMDVQMPEMDGFEATQAIRALEGTLQRTPIVAMTAGSMTACVLNYSAGRLFVFRRAFHRLRS